MKKSERTSAAAQRYANFINESGNYIRKGLSNFGKDMEKEKLLFICRIFMVAAAVMTIVCAIRTAMNFGLM